MNSYQQALLPDYLKAENSSRFSDVTRSFRSKITSKNISYSKIATYLVVLVMILPIITVAASLFSYSEQSNISHLLDTVMLRYVINSAILVVGVCSISFAIGTSTAWLLTMYNFPLSNILKWAMVLPMAMPAYIMAMVYGNILEPAGFLQTWFRDSTGLAYHDYYFPDIRSIGGVIIMLSLALYPYVYILSRNAFAQNSRQFLDSASMLGVSKFAMFFRIALPVARPAIIIAIALVGMETLADFGTVSLYGVDSFTTGIYRTWYGMGDMIGAARLAAVLLLLVGGVLWIERNSRKNSAYNNGKSLFCPIKSRISINGWKKYLAMLTCLTPIMLGFAIPLATLASWSLDSSLSVGGYGWADIMTWNALGNSMIIAICVVILSITIAILFSMMMRRYKSDKNLISSIRVASLGYAIPGSIIAIGIMIPMLWLDKKFADFMYNSFNIDIGLLITGSIAAIVIACSIRFMAVALGCVESSLQSISNMVDDAACVLGHCKKSIACRIHLPIIKTGLLMAAIMLFVDTIKELPATIMLRPFNFDTLAVRTYELAMDEQLYAAATPAIIMILLGIAPVILLSAKLGCPKES